MRRPFVILRKNIMAEETQAKHIRGRLLFLVLGILIGVLALLLIRFITYAPEHTHYHANFAAYINGQREDFKGAQYYQEVKVCDLEGTSPQARTHMHDGKAGVVHVHDNAVTWGQFFENIGWIVGPDFVRTPDKLYVADDTNKLNIILNEDDLTDLSTITNEVIGDKDRLLISYGPADAATLEKQFSSVGKDAAEYNAKQDPASCGGNGTPSFDERIRNLL